MDHDSRRRSVRATELSRLATPADAVAMNSQADASGGSGGSGSAVEARSSGSGMEAVVWPFGGGSW